MGSFYKVSLLLIILWVVIVSVILALRVLKLIGDPNEIILRTSVVLVILAVASGVIGFLVSLGKKD